MHENGPLWRLMRCVSVSCWRQAVVRELRVRAHLEALFDIWYASRGPVILRVPLCMDGVTSMAATLIPLAKLTYQAAKGGNEEKQKKIRSLRMASLSYPHYPRMLSVPSPCEGLRTGLPHEATIQAARRCIVHTNALHCFGFLAGQELLCFLAAWFESGQPTRVTLSYHGYS